MFPPHSGADRTLVVCEHCGLAEVEWVWRNTWHRAKLSWINWPQMLCSTEAPREVRDLERPMGWSSPSVCMCVKTGNDCLIAWVQTLYIHQVVQWNRNPRVMEGLSLYIYIYVIMYIMSVLSLSETSSFSIPIYDRHSCAPHPKKDAWTCAGFGVSFARHQNLVPKFWVPKGNLKRKAKREKPSHFVKIYLSSHR